VIYPPWKIVVINLAHRTDRLAAFNAQASKSRILKGRVQLFKALSPADIVPPKWWQGELPWARLGSFACLASHLAVWNAAIIQGVPHLLVFEDDAVLSDDFDSLTRAMWAEAPDDWFGYYLGGHWAKENAPYSESCLRFRGSLGTHAYGLSAAGLVRAYEHVTWLQHGRGSCIDNAMIDLTRHHEPNRFFMPPRWVVAQAPGMSDIQHQNVAGTIGWE
jgi:GR25 family glycosyltransferase involved in LPS biosynthesis